MKPRTAEHEEARKAFFAKGQPCLRASDLGKRYGWGVHSNAQGRVALYGVQTPEYASFVSCERDAVAWKRMCHTLVMARIPNGTSIVVGPQGRVVIPASVCRDMGIGEGDRLGIERDGDRLVLVPQDAEVRRIQGMFKHLGDGNVTADLIAERRRDATNEA